MSDTRYLNAQEAADELSISLPTLYAYVSRGLIRSEAIGGSKRNRRYYAEDVQKLKDRKDHRRSPEKMVESALHFGAPLLDSAITLIEDGKLYYRGLDALELAADYRVEQVAALIWAGDLDAEISTFSERDAFVLPPRCLDVLPSIENLTPFERFQVLLPLAAVDDATAYDLRPSTVMNKGARILRLLTAIAIKQDSIEGGIADSLQRAWTHGDPQASKLISAALILCADHELNISSFTARCVASAGSTPYAAVIAGLAALQGSKHGGHTERVERLVRDIGALGSVQSALGIYLKQGELIPGFGHPLYPDGDPRGRMLLEMAAQFYSDSEAVRLGQTVVDEVFAQLGKYPSLDFALVTLAQALDLPPGAPIALFALGRTIGWIGHAIEQYEADRMIRPRARYIGAAPTTDF